MEGTGEVFLAALDEGEAGELKERGIVRTYQRGTALFHEQQTADRVMLIQKGWAKLSALSEDGKEVVLAIRGPGDLVGELSAIDGEPRSATATALAPVDVLVLAAGDFRAFLERNPRVALLLVAMLARRLRDADRKRVEFTAQDSTGRVAARVVELSERFGDEVEQGLRIDLPISQEELAGWTGCSRDSVVKALHAMRELGWIETERRRITVLDVEALRRRAR